MTDLSALMDTGIKVEAVLADEVYRDVELVPMLCAEITDKKQTSTLLRELSVQFPLPEFTHLKRVKGGEIPRVLICALESESEDSVERVSARLQSADLAGLGGTSVVWVPHLQPTTRSQYNKLSLIWPTHFHEDKMLEKSLRGEMFLPKELSDIKKFMEFALTHNNSSANEFLSNVIVVDPSTREVVAQASTDSSHPLKHAVMLCLDQLASVQGGGAWSHTPDLPPAGEGRGVPRDKSLCPPAKRARVQYLATGYDVYCSAEPCLMCSMALLHSRIGRVFFCHANPSSGGLYSQYKLHTNKKLNHHFQVYKCTLTCMEGSCN